MGEEEGGRDSVISERQVGFDNVMDEEGDGIEY